MKVILLVVALAHAVMCGNIARTSTLLSPAGVTYVDGSYHAGLAAGPVGYASSVAAAPVTTATAAPAVYASAPVATATAAPAVYASAPAVYSSAPAVAAAPVATVSATYASAPAVAAPAVYTSAPAATVSYSAPVTKYAAVPTVQHVPAVADVPVTRINAQPGVIQKTLDVARPAVKTQRYEVRRPAIQKQFYDIEERVVVRPAGSAVVELDEPLSRTQKGPSVIQATGEGVTVSSSQSIAVPTGPGVSVSSGETPLPSVDYSIRESGSGALPPAPPAPQAPIPVSGSIYAGQTSAVLPPSAPVQSAPVHSVSVSAPAQPISGVSSGHHTFSAGASGTAFSTPSPQYSDSVTIDSAAYRAPSVQSHQASAYQTVSSAPSQSDSLTRAVFHSNAQQSYSSAPQVYSAAPQVYSAAPQVHSAAPQVYSTAPQVYSAAPQSYSSAPASAPVYQARETFYKSVVPTARYSGHVASAPARAATVATYPTSIGYAPQQKFSSSAAIYSDGGAQSQINHENQQKLIQLLTARGGVAEVGFGRSGSASYPVQAGEVRGRVISATPAPAYAAPTDERVNTRRVVVSRPIETVQDVEVAEPVTKYERVHVSQPTVIKTASQDVVRVPTSVPVYGKAFAPVAEESYATISSEWQ